MMYILEGVMVYIMEGSRCVHLVHPIQRNVFIEPDRQLICCMF